MAFDDLRSFLQALDDHGQLLKISEEVNAEPDLAAAANATGRIGDGAPALWFDNCNQVNHLIPTRVLVKGGEITCKILK